MKYLLYFLIVTFCVNAQNGYKTVLLPNGEKGFWDIAKPDISKSAHSYVIRYEAQNQIVNLYSNDSINFTGTVLSYLIEQKTSRKGTVDYQYVYNIADLSDEKCSVVGRKIFSEKFYNLPTDDSIKGYSKNWLDCFGIAYEFKIKDSILNKNYICPWSWAQNDTIPEIVKLTENYSLIDSIFQLKKIETDFESQLEKGKWYSDGLTVIYKMTNKQSAVWKAQKPVRDYLQTNKKDIENYIKEKLDTQKNFPSVSCTLTFSKKGELTKIQSKENGENISGSEFKKFKHTIKKAFNDFNPSPLKLLYNFKIDIDFYKGGIIINNPYPTNSPYL